MATTFQPFGLKPVYHPSGLDRAVPFVGTNTFGVGSGNYTAPYQLNTGESFYQYQPVQLRTNSAGSVLGIADVTATTSPANNVYGVFDGVEFTDSQGRRSVSKWASKLTLDAATQIVFWIFQDPNIVYEAQINGSATASAIGSQYDFDTTNTPAVGYSIGNGGAGFSQAALEASPNSTGTQGQVRVVGLGREVAFPSGVTNQWGDAYTIVQVTIANNSFVAPKVSV
jgi:hypothetical protein